jgi:hypothetical protein
LTATENALNDPSKENLNILNETKNYLINRFVPYKKVIQALVTNAPEKWRTIQEGLSDLGSNSIFLLQDGEIEDYLEIKKGLEPMIQFLRNDYNCWKEKYPNRFNEFYQILEKITNN